MREPTEEADKAAKEILETLPQFENNKLYLDCVSSIIQSAINKAIVRFVAETLAERAGAENPTRENSC